MVRGLLPSPTATKETVSGESMVRPGVCQFRHRRVTNLPTRRAA